jgi:hypothetical protein
VPRGVARRNDEGRARSATTPGHRPDISVSAIVALVGDDHAHDVAVDH